MEQVMMMMIKSPEISRNEKSFPEDPITTSTCNSWKLYENPFYYSQNHQQNYNHHQQQCQCNKHNSLHRLQLPISARKIAASFWDLTFFRSIMETELELARAQIIELKAELEYERKARKKAESINKRLAKELAEERRGREAMERVCEQLAREMSNSQSEIDRMKREMENERKMLRMAEVLREERVQMKLTEAKILFEEKLLKLTDQGADNNNPSTSRNENKNQIEEDKDQADFDTDDYISGRFSRLGFGEKSISSEYYNSGVDSRETSTRLVLGHERSLSSREQHFSSVSSMATHRKASPEPENPHIKRGIKGFVEFPRVVRAIGSKGRHWGTKLECQKAQLKILLKQKSPIKSASLIMS